VIPVLDHSLVCLLQLFRRKQFQILNGLVQFLKERLLGQNIQETRKLSQVLSLSKTHSVTKATQPTPSSETITTKQNNNNSNNN
jgi:hypothetical protein